jgi:tetratricopeptide (TPR) repeat protein
MTKRKLSEPLVAEYVPLHGADDDETEAALLRRIEDTRARGRPAALEAAVLQLAIFCSRAGRQRRAISEMERLALESGSPALAARALLRHGQLLEQVRDYESACGPYARGIEIGTPEPRTRYFLRNNLAFCLLELGRPAEAEPLCRAAIAIDPRRHNAHKNLGLALTAQDRPAEAATAYLDATELAPKDTRALMHLQALLSESAGLLEGSPELRERLERALAAARVRARKLQ